MRSYVERMRESPGLNGISAISRAMFDRSSKRKHDVEHIENVLEEWIETIIDKYSKAFRFDEDLLAIVDYIEYIIDKDQNRIGLHLAAALVYRQISDTAL